MAQDNNRLGLLLMIGFCVLAPASDALVKILGDGIPLLQVVIARFIAQLFLVRRNLWTSRHDTWMRADRLGYVILRSILHLVAISFFFLSLRYLPLADAIAIAYVLPFLILGVGWMTGDRASPLSLGLCLLGFIGTLMVVQPSFAEVGWPALLPRVVAVLFTGFMFITRKISKHIDPIDLQAANGVCAMVTLLPIAACRSMGSIFLEILRVMNIKPVNNTATISGKSAGQPTSAKLGCTTIKVPMKPSRQSPRLKGLALSPFIQPTPKIRKGRT